MTRQYIIRLDSYRWMKAERGQTMMKALPVDMSIPAMIMVDLWWAIATEPVDFVSGLIIDAFAEYNIDEEFLESYPNETSESVTKQYIEPWYDTLIRIVYDMHANCAHQMTPLMSHPTNAGLQAKLLQLCNPFSALISIDPMDYSEAGQRAANTSLGRYITGPKYMAGLVESPSGINPLGPADFQLFRQSLTVGSDQRLMETVV